MTFVIIIVCFVLGRSVLFFPSRTHPFFAVVIYLLPHAFSLLRSLGVFARELPHVRPALMGML